MSNYLKPQSPLRDKSSGDFFYPLTTEDQVIMNDGNRLSGANFLSVEKYNAAEGEIPLNNADTLGGKTEIELSVAKAVDSDKLGGYTAEEYVRHIQNMPKAGFIYPLASEVVPEGFLLCDGSEYSRTEYVELFAAIGTIYGEGDGSTTFNVPNLQTRVPVGSGENYELGSTGGETNVKLKQDNLPDSAIVFTSTANHSEGIHWSTGTWNSYGQGYAALPLNQSVLSFGQPHNNMQPYTVVNYIIATGKNTGVNVQDVIKGVQALPLGVEYGGTGATNVEDARNNLEITPENIGAMSKMELLWENSSPYSTFPAQTISLDLSEYTFFDVEFTYAASVGHRKTVRCPQNSKALASFYAFGLSNNARVFNTKEDGIAFEGGNSGTASDNNACIPYAIYGIKGALV